MPFDFPAEPSVITPPKTLEGLSFALRHRELWPVGFEWDYRSCGKCALGLAVQLFSEENKHRPCISVVEQSLGVSFPGETGKNIFVNLSTSLDKFMSDITPEDVADAIDAYLEAA